MAPTGLTQSRSEMLDRARWRALVLWPRARASALYALWGMNGTSASNVLPPRPPAIWHGSRRPHRLLDIDAALHDDTGRRAIGRQGYAIPRRIGGRRCHVSLRDDLGAGLAGESGAATIGTGGA